jgi:hypothetical protein
MTLATLQKSGKKGKKGEDDGKKKSHKAWASISQTCSPRHRVPVLTPLSPFTSHPFTSHLSPHTAPLTLSPPTSHISPLTSPLTLSPLTSPFTYHLSSHLHHLHTCLLSALLIPCIETVVF